MRVGNVYIYIYIIHIYRVNVCVCVCACACGCVCVCDVDPNCMVESWSLVEPLTSGKKLTKHCDAYCAQRSTQFSNGHSNQTIPIVPDMGLRPSNSSEACCSVMMSMMISTWSHPKTWMSNHRPIEVMDMFAIHRSVSRTKFMRSIKSTGPTFCMSNCFFQKSQLFPPTCATWLEKVTEHIARYEGWCHDSYIQPVPQPIIGTKEASPMKTHSCNKFDSEPPQKSLKPTRCIHKW